MEVLINEFGISLEAITRMEQNIMSNTVQEMPKYVIKSKFFNEKIAAIKEVDDCNVINESFSMDYKKAIDEVRALKIGDIQPNKKFNGTFIITPSDEGYGSFILQRDYIEKHNPQIGGYYVVYKNGSKSYSPAKAFEEGYSLNSKKDGGVTVWSPPSE